MSHAVEGNSGSKPLPNDDCMPIHMVGGTPTIQARLGGVDVLCMVDSGSMVSFVTEDFYKKKLQPTCGHMRKDGQMLTLRAANGLKIPYLGYLELTVEVDGVKVPSCGVLVLKDTPATTKQRRDIPGLLGTNVLAQIPQFGALLQQRPNAEPRTSENPSSGNFCVTFPYFVLSLVLFVIRFSFFFCIKHSFKPTPCIQRIHVVVPLLFGLRPLVALNRSRRSVTFWCQEWDASVK